MTSEVQFYIVLIWSNFFYTLNTIGRLINFFINLILFSFEIIIFFLENI